jgi:hypothetical protein
VSPPAWREEPIGRRHDRTGFGCGDGGLDDWLRRFARQSHASGGAKTFVAVAPAEPERVLGFYSVSPGSLAHARTPGLLRRGLGRYGVPVFRLGRLAVDQPV